MNIHARDIIAVLVLIALFFLKYIGMNGLIDTSIALVIGYYFSKRVYEEKEGKGNGKRK